MIILQTGWYTKKGLQAMDYGTTELPTTKQSILVVNPSGYGIPSYRISKHKENGKWLYRIAILTEYTAS